MKALLIASGGAIAAAVALVGTGQASAETIDVTGRPYAQAVALLKAQGVKAVFGGAYGHDMPQAQCAVVDMTPSSGGYVRLRLDCTRPDDLPATGPIPGANGVTTITPTPVPYRPPGVPVPAPPAAPPPPLG